MVLKGCDHYISSNALITAVLSECLAAIYSLVPEETQRSPASNLLVLYVNWNKESAQ